MKIEVVLTEAEIIQELTEAVEARDLPEKFFYWGPLRIRIESRSRKPSTSV